MVLTRSMATNNNKGDEPRTALERQVQTLAVVMERLIRQNHDLEEQLRQRDARPNSHRRSKRAPLSKRGTEKDWRVAVPQIGRSDKIPVVR